MKKRSKVTALIMGLLLVALVFSGCSNNASQSPSTTPGGKDQASNKTVELRYALWDQNQLPAYQKIIDEFMKENPNIKVKIEMTPNADYWTKMTTQVAGKNAPDVFWMQNTYFDLFRNRNAIKELTPLIKRDNLDLNKYKKEFIDAFSQDGKIYGIPKDWDNVGYIYNKEIFAQAGYDKLPDDLVWNPVDGGTFVKFMQKLTIDKNGKHPGEAGFDPKNIKQYAMNYISRLGQLNDNLSYLKSNGADILTPDNKKLGFDNKEGKETLKFMHDLVYKYYLHPPLSEIRTTGGEPLFYSGRVAMWQTGPWMLSGINNNAKFKWAVGKVPKGPKGRIVRANGLSDTISATTQFPEESWKLVKYIVTKKGQDILGNTGTVFPAYEDSMNTYIDFYKAKGIDVTTFVDQFKEGAALLPRYSDLNKVDAIYLNTFGLALNGEMDVNEAIDKLIKEGSAVLAE